MNHTVLTERVVDSNSTTNVTAGNGSAAEEPLTVVANVTGYPALVTFDRSGS